MNFEGGLNGMQQVERAVGTDYAFTECDAHT